MSRKSEIWQTYIQLKRNKDTKSLSALLRDEYSKKVIVTTDFDVYLALSSNMYHRISCGYISRSRKLRSMKRSDAILGGFIKCNSCIKDPIDTPLFMKCFVIAMCVVLLWIVVNAFI